MQKNNNTHNSYSSKSPVLYHVKFLNFQSFFNTNRDQNPSKKKMTVSRMGTRVDSCLIQRHQTYFSGNVVNFGAFLALLTISHSDESHSSMSLLWLR